MIRVRPVHADAGAVRVSYSRFAAARVQCGDWRDDLGFNPSNRLAHNFGCAVRAGVGLMVADPADLQVSRPAASHDSMRSNVVVQKYRAGEPTAARAPKEDQVIFSLTRGK
jgi:pilus biogenesis lipoprotein CpaD